MADGTLIGAGIALFSGLSGAFLQAIVGRRSEYIKAGRQARYNAYADYFKGIAALSHPGSADERATAHALIADARGRIGLYGSAEVVMTMTKMFRHGENLWSPSAIQDISAMLAAMRADVLWVDPKVSPECLHELLYGRAAVQTDKTPAQP